MVRELPRLASRRHSVALVGIDGSGKSTQARLLCRGLKAQHKDALLIHPFGRKVASFLPNRFVAWVSAGSGGRRRPRGRAGGWLGHLAAIVELLDIGAYIWAAHIRSLAMALREDCEVWLVSDRSLDDLLVKHRRLQTLAPGVLAMARRLAPVPQRTIWLYTEPEIAMQRDGDFDASYYQELHAGYMVAAQQYGWDILYTCNQPPDAVAAEIVRLLGLGGWQMPAGEPGPLSPRPTPDAVRSPEAQIKDLGES